MMNTIKKVICLSIFLSLMSLYSGCIEETEQNQQTSLTKVLISDAPSDNFSHINVTYSQVKIHRSGSDNDSGWILFDTNTTTVDMIYLHENNLSEVLGVTNLTFGTYSKLWIVVDAAMGVLKDSDEEIVFHVPSGTLKIQQSFMINSSNSTIDIEIDLDRSVLYVPQGRVYKLLPVISTVNIDRGDRREDDSEEEGELTVDAGVIYDGGIGESIEFKGKAEGGKKPYNWSWNFGDDNTSNMKNPTYKYNESGVYTAILTVRDDKGNIALDSAIVEIKEE